MSTAWDLEQMFAPSAAIAAWGQGSMQVVLTTGYQHLPPEFAALPTNFRHATYLPGRAMAER